MGLPQHALMLRVVWRRSQFGSSLCMIELVWRAWRILVQSVFIVNLLLSHGYSRLPLRRVYTLNPPTFRSPTRRRALVCVQTTSPCFRLQFPVFLYAPGANGGLHRLLPWKLPSFKISACCSLVYFFDCTWLKHRYFHSGFQVLLRLDLRAKRLHISTFMLTRPRCLMTLNCILKRFAILCSFLFIFAWIFVALQYDFEDFIVPSCRLSYLILGKFLRVMKLRILVLYLNLLEILNS